MNRNNFPIISLALSVPLMAVLVFGAQPGPDDTPRLPLLTLLAISEFGTIANAVAAGLATAPLLQGRFEPARIATAIAALGFAAAFIWYLVRFWPF